MAANTKEESTSAVVSELNKQFSEVNIINEYEDIFSKALGSNHKLDKIANESASLAVLKGLVEETKNSIKKDGKKIKWEFATSPHEHFGKTLDDTYTAFLKWARVKEDMSKVNVSRALRRLEAYAEWMHEAEADLTEPLTAKSVKKAVDTWAFNSSVDKEGRLVWWMDLGNVDVAKMKTDFTPEDHLRAYVWYNHGIMYNTSAQENGMVAVDNMNKIGIVQFFTLMSAKLSTKLDRLMIGAMPIHMQCMYMFEAPTWCTFFMKVVGAFMFMRKKSKERIIFLKDWSDTSTDKIGGLEAIPKGFGKENVKGTLVGDVVEDAYFSPFEAIHGSYLVLGTELQLEPAGLDIGTIATFDDLDSPSGSIERASFSSADFSNAINFESMEKFASELELDLGVRDPLFDLEVYDRSDVTQNSTLADFFDTANEMAIGAGANAKVFNRGGIYKTAEASAINPLDPAPPLAFAQESGSPTSQGLDLAMGQATGANLRPDELELLSKKPKKKSKSTKAAPDAELLRRRKAASLCMISLGLSPDVKVDGDRGQMCTVCGKRWKFELTFAGSGAKICHRKLMESKGSPQFLFCPLADDHSILTNHMLMQKEKKRVWEKERKQKQRMKKKQQCIVVR